MEPQTVKVKLKYITGLNPITDRGFFKTWIILQVDLDPLGVKSDTSLFLLFLKFKFILGQRNILVTEIHFIKWKPIFYCVGPTSYY